MNCTIYDMIYESRFKLSDTWYNSQFNYYDSNSKALVS